MKIAEIFKYLQEHNFLLAKLEKSTSFNIQFQSLGKMLSNNIQTHLVPQSEEPIYCAPKGSIRNLNEKPEIKDALSFHLDPHFLQNFLEAKKNFPEIYPLTIKEEIDTSNSSVVIDNSIQLNFTEDHTKICTSMIYNYGDGIENFHIFQRKRKIKWMKFSSNPSRYFTDIVETTPDEGKLVRIHVKFSLGSFPVENIMFTRLQNKDFLLENKNTQTNYSPSVVRSEIPLEIATTAFLLDSLEHRYTNVMQFDRKFAPYQCSVIFSPEEKSKEVLSELSDHLTDIMKDSKITVFDSKKNHVKTLDEQIIELDKIGVPYSVILDDGSLQNGLMKLRSRDTTISEIIHISDIPSYLVAIYTS